MGREATSMQARSGEQERALGLPDEQALIAALDVLGELATRLPIVYEPMVDDEQRTYAIVVPARDYAEAARALDARGLASWAVPVVSITELPADERARLRRREWLHG